MAEDDKIVGIVGLGIFDATVDAAKNLPMFSGMCIALRVAARTNYLSLKCSSWPSQPSGLNFGQQPVVLMLSS
jgi:hypothetical protein